MASPVSPWSHEPRGSVLVRLHGVLKDFDFSFPAFRNQELSHKISNLCVLLITWKLQPCQKAPLHGSAPLERSRRGWRGGSSFMDCVPANVHGGDLNSDPTVLLPRHLWTPVWRARGEERRGREPGKHCGQGSESSSALTNGCVTNIQS